MTDEQRDNFNNEKGKTCKNWWEYLNGLRNRVKKGLATIIVYHAIKNNVNIIFIEDLDLKPYFLDKKDENKLKSLLAISETIKYLKGFAKKHSIAVVAVNPEMTSQIDHQTGEIGYRDKSTLWVKQGDGKMKGIDADINAAHNIAIRGITRHRNMASFKVQPVSDTEWITAFEEDEGIQKQGSLIHIMEQSNPENIISHKDVRWLKFTKNGDDTIDIFPIKDKKSYESLKIKVFNKYDHIVYSGKNLYLKKHIDSINKKSYDEMVL